MWTVPEAKGISRSTEAENKRLKSVTEGCNPSIDVKREYKFGEISTTQNAVESLDKTISNLEMELSAARAVQDSIFTGSYLFSQLLQFCTFYFFIW